MSVILSTQDGITDVGDLWTIGNFELSGLENCANVRKGKQNAVQYVREESKRLWVFLHECTSINANEDSDNLHEAREDQSRALEQLDGTANGISGVEGRPALHHCVKVVKGCSGVEKSTLIFGWTMRMATHFGFSVLWVHRSVLDEYTLLRVLNGRVESGLLDTFEGRLSSNQLHGLDFIVLDSFGKDTDDVIKKAYRNTRGQRTTIVACTSCENAGASLQKGRREINLQTHEMCSWVFAEYVAAWRARPELFPFPTMESLMEQYYYAGGSFSMMTDSCHAAVRKSLEDVLTREGDVQGLLAALVRRPAPRSRSPLVQVIRNRSGEPVPVLVSQYVMRRLSLHVPVDLIKQCRGLLPDNSNWLDWCHEGEVLCKLRNCVINHKVVTFHKRPITLFSRPTLSFHITAFCEYHSLLARPRTPTQTTLIVPNSWCHGAFDAIIWVPPSGLYTVPDVYFLQCTRAETVDHQLQYLAEILQALVPLSTTITAAGSIGSTASGTAGNSNGNEVLGTSVFPLPPAQPTATNTALPTELALPSGPSLTAPTTAPLSAATTGESKIKAQVTNAKRCHVHYYVVTERRHNFETFNVTNGVLNGLDIVARWDPAFEKTKIRVAYVNI